MGQAVTPCSPVRNEGFRRGMDGDVGYLTMLLEVVFSATDEEVERGKRTRSWRLGSIVKDKRKPHVVIRE